MKGKMRSKMGKVESEGGGRRQLKPAGNSTYLEVVENRRNSALVGGNKQSIDTMGDVRDLWPYSGM